MERERRQMDAEVALHCIHRANVFAAVSKARLTDHTYQKYVLQLKSMCQFSSKYFINRVFITTKDIV